ncbi:MAG: hypothetical protein Q8P62_04435 [Candidatus Peregrinibacteria bacterium]|nr:hypothetical protein [Candidatus Peregrinibacteria bacterium]
MSGFSKFEGLDGGGFEVGPRESFVWERDATKRMVQGAGKPSRAGVRGFATSPVRSKHFVEIPDDSLALKKTSRRGFSDLHEAPEIMDLSGGVDISERLGGFPELHEVAEHIGLRVDSVGVVGLGRRGGFHKPEGEEFISEAEVAEQERRAFDLQLARAERAERFRRNGKGVEGGKNDTGVVEMDRGVFNLQLTRAQRAVGIGRNGRVLRGKGGAGKSSDGSAASV